MVSKLQRITILLVALSFFGLGFERIESLSFHSNKPGIISSWPVPKSSLKKSSLVATSLTLQGIVKSDHSLPPSSCCSLQSSPTRIRAHNYYTHHNMSNNSSNASDDRESLQKQSSLLNNYVITKIGSSASTVVAGTFFLVLSYKRDAFMLTFFIGSILNGITSKVLKKILNQDRPDGFKDNSCITVKPSDKGMPSSHAMSLGFIGIYTAVSLCNGVLQNAGIATHFATCCTLILYVTACLIYRVQTQLHTLDQVLVGLFFGTMNGLIWYSLATGSNFVFSSVNLVDSVSTCLLPHSGILPVKFLIFPLFVGAAVVGSFERRIAAWVKGKEKNN